MGEEHHTRRASRFPPFMVVVSFPRFYSLTVNVPRSGGVRAVFAHDVFNEKFVLSCLAACSGTCIAQRPSDETRAITPAKPKPSTTM